PLWIRVDCVAPLRSMRCIHVARAIIETPSEDVNSELLHLLRPRLCPISPPRPRRAPGSGTPRTADRKRAPGILVPTPPLRPGDPGPPRAPEPAAGLPRGETWPWPAQTRWPVPARAAPADARAAVHASPAARGPRPARCRRAV